MGRLERFVKAVEYLKTKADKPTNDGVSRLLRYNTDSYISDVIGKSKAITPPLLKRMVEFSINPEWIESGKGEMIMHHAPKNGQALDASSVKVTLQDYIDKQEERIQELKRDKDLLYQIINSTLGRIYDDSHTALAYQKAWVKYEAERSSGGNKEKEDEIRYKMSKLVDDELESDELSGNHDETGI